MTTNLAYWQHIKQLAHVAAKATAYANGPEAVELLRLNILGQIKDAQDRGDLPKGDTEPIVRMQDNALDLCANIRINADVLGTVVWRIGGVHTSWF